MHPTAVMTSPTHLESLATRFAPHVELLHDFFASRGVHFGAPMDVKALAVRLSVPGSFHDEMCSILRTIIYREDTNVNRVELLELITLAVGGPGIDQTTEDLHEPVGQLLLFVNVVLLSLRKKPFGSEGEISQDHPAAAPTVSDQKFPQPPRNPPRSEDAPQVERNPPIPAILNAFSAETNAARPEHQNLPLPENPERRPSTATREIEPPANDLKPYPANDEAARFADRQNASNDFASRSVDSPRPPRHDLSAMRSSRERRLLSRPAALLTVLLLVGLAAIMLFSRKSTNRSFSAPANHDVNTPYAASIPKPSAYGSPLGGENAPELASPGQDSRSAEQLRATHDAALPEAARQGASDSQSGQPTQPAQPSDIFTSNQASAVPSAASPSATELGNRSPAQIPDTAKDRLRRIPDTFSGRRGPHRGLFAVSSGVMSANLIAAPPPDYPTLARLTHVEGQVILQAVVSRSGSVVATHVLQGHRLLRGAAERAVQRWRYRPYLMEGKPTDVETVVFVNFRLRH